MSLSINLSPPCGEQEREQTGNSNGKCGEAGEYKTTRSKDEDDKDTVPVYMSFIRSNLFFSFLFFLFRVSVVISFQSSASGCGDRSPGERGSHDATDTVLLPPPSPHYTLSPFSSPPPLAGNHNH